MEQLLAHLVGDYILQSHDMAISKTKSTYWAFYHAFTYTLPFLILSQSSVALSIIIFTHFIIDRFRLAIKITKVKNYLLGTFKKEIFNSVDGYPEETPAWLSTWLIIILDNTLHLVINHLALSNF
jgi:hypothetical protein